MAARKPAPKAPEPKKPGTDLAPWKEKLKAHAKKAVAIEQNAGSGNQFIKLRGGQITLGDQVCKDNTLACVILDHTIEYAMYDGDYDPESPQSPICFSFGEDEATMVPHDMSREKQHENCKDCPMNKFGSADRGAGKACKNIRRLVLIAENDLDDLDNAKPIFLKVPVTSAKNWTSYVRKLDSTLEMPPLAVVTNITTKPHPKHQFEVVFTLAEQIEDGELIEGLFKLMEASRNDLVAPYTSTGDAEEEAPRRGSNKLSGRKATPAKAAARGRR